MKFLQFKKYVEGNGRSCVSVNSTMKSFACWLLLGDNTSLSHKKHGRQIGPQYVYRLFPTSLFYVYVNK